MTIHRAKGLEFDAVILFGLDRRVRGSDPKLIYWDTFGANEPTSGVLLAAMSTNEDPLVRYLQRVDRDLDRAERARLLYVAVTRAKRRLHLIGHLGEETNGSDGAAAGSLMSWLSSQFRELDKDESLEEGDDLPEQPWIVTPLIALEDHDGIPVGPLASRPLDIPSERPVYDWASLTAAHVGTVVHRALQKISVTTAPEGVGLRQMVAPDTTEFEQELRLLGVPPKALPAAGRRVREILESVQSDPQGQWILGAHSDAQSELALAVLQRGEVSHLQIDRTFIDRAGTRWIIDYKTSRHAGGDLDLFIAAELERYRDQLETYARALYRIDARPIRVGLYFPVLGVFRDWVPSVCADG
jgi:ATP-dependent exoDNAse (exonuclease V) beta subunit